MTSDLQRHLAREIAIQQKALFASSRGTRVTILVGKYAGREAVIDGVTLDSEWGLWLFCCYVLRAGSDAILNTDGESRMYRSTDQFVKVAT